MITYANAQPVFDIEPDHDGWWTITRNGWRLDGEFLTCEEAEAAVHSYELDDEEAEREAREQDDDEFGARVDYEVDRDR